MLNLRNKILFLAAALVIASQIATVGMVLLTTKDKQIERSSALLATNTRLLKAVTSSQASQAESTINALASDFAFKRAIATADLPTVQSALENQSKRAGAVVAMVLDAEHNLLASNSPIRIQPEDADKILAASTQGSADRTMIMLDDNAFFMITAPIRAPLTIGWLTMGYPIDDAYADQLAKLVGMQVSFFSTRDYGTALVSSSLPDEDQAGLNRMFSELLESESLLEPATIAINNVEYLGIRSDYVTNQEGLQVLASVPMSEALATYSLIRQAAILLACIPLAVALIGALMFSRALTSPIRELMQAAKRIQVGDYDQTVTIDTTDELSEFAVAFNSMRKEIAARENRISYQAKHDGVTGLYNRDAALESLGASIHRAKEEHAHLAVMIISLNAGHQLSGTLGHKIVDSYLERAAEQIRTFVSQDFVVARLELDNFLVLVTNTGQEGARQLAQDLTARLSPGIRLPDINVAVTPRTGIAVFPEHGDSKERLMLRATIAKSESTANERPVSIYREGAEEHRVRNMALLHDLRSAVQDNNLKMHYQPKIKVADESVCGVEALVRWDHPVYGWLPPNDFIPIIEQSGNISILTRWALETVGRQHQQWREDGLDLDVAINLSAHDLQDQDLPWFIMDILRETRLPAEQLIAEITEQAMVQDFQNATTVLTRLRDLGIKISIDDFGTGYSSLSHLKNLPVDELKIDRSFIDSLPGDPADEAIVSTAIDLAHKLRLTTVAEGVASGETYRWLQTHGIDRAQGFYWSKAMPGNELSAWIETYTGGSTQIIPTIELVKP